MPNNSLLTASDVVLDDNEENPIVIPNDTNLKEEQNPETYVGAH